MRLARLPRPRPRPLRRALSARGNKGPPRPYDESYKGNAVRWTERQGLHVAAAWVYFGAFVSFGTVWICYNFVTGVPRRIYEIYDHTVNPRAPDATEEVRNPLYRDVGFGDDQLHRRRRPGGDWRYRFTDDELAELGRMGVDVDSRYGGPTKEQRQVILAARRFRSLRERVDSGRLSDDDKRELQRLRKIRGASDVDEKIRELTKNRDQLDAQSRAAVDLWNSLRVADDGSGKESEE